MKSRFTILMLLLLYFFVGSPYAQTIDRSIMTTNSTVYSSVQKGDTLYIGGDFSQVGYGFAGLARFSGNSDKPDFSFPTTNSSIQDIEPDGGGGYYYAGYLTYYKGIALDLGNPGYPVGVIHVLADLSLDPAFTPVDVGGNTVTSVKKKGNSLYIGGNFATVSGNARPYLASVNPVTGALLNWVPDAPVSTVEKIEATDSLVFVNGSSMYAIGGYYLYSRFATLKATTGKLVKDFPSAGNGQVYSTLVKNNKIYIGGNFSNFGKNAPYLTSVNNSGITDGNFPWTDGVVYAIFNDGANGYYIGGSFYTVGNITGFGGLAHILSNGTVDAAFQPQVNGTVFTITSDGTNLYFGGSFTYVNSTIRNYAASVNKNNGSLKSWDPNADNWVWTMIHISGAIYMGGQFTNVKGSTRNFAAAVTTGNSLSSWAPDPDSYVYQMVPNANGTSIFMCGQFYTVKGSTRPYVVKVNSSNGNPSNWQPNPNNWIYTIALNGSILYMGGYFGTINGNSRAYLAGVDTTSNNPNSLVADANGPVVEIDVNAGKLYVGGSFNQIQSVERQSVARIDIATGNVDSWNPSLNTYPEDFAFSGSNVIMGGNFSIANFVNRQYITAIDVNSYAITSFNPNAASLSGTCQSLLVNNNELFAGGNLYYYDPSYTIQYTNILPLDTTTGNVTRYFDYYPQGGGITSMAIYDNKLAVNGSNSYYYPVAGGDPIIKYNLASYNLGSNTLTSLQYDPNTSVLALQADAGNSLIAGGLFDLVNYKSRQYLAAINLTTGRATNWQAYPDGSVRALAIKDTSLFVGGYFGNFYNSDYTIVSPRAALGALSTNSGLATAWNADANGLINSLAIKDTLLYVGGAFNTLKGTGRNFAACVGTGGTGSLKSWNPDPNSYVLAVQPVGNNVYLSGYFSTLKGTARNYLGMVNNGNGNLNSWNPSPDNYVYTLTANATTLYAGGQFTNISGQSRNAVAAYNTSSNALTSFNPKLSNTNGGQVLLQSTGIYGKTLFMGSDPSFYFSMDSIKGNARHILGAADTTNGSATSFNPSPDNEVYHINIGTTKMFVGGYYWQNISGGSSPKYFATYTLEPLTPASSLSFTNLQTTSVKANWTSGSGEGRLVSVREGAAANSPNDGNNYNANAAFGQGSSISNSYVTYKGTGSNVTVTSLRPNHTYYFGVYEYNGSGVGTEYLQNPALTGSVTTPCPTYSNIVTPPGPVAICNGDSVTLTALANMTTYAWSNGKTTRSIVVKTAGSYSVTITDSNACGGTSSPVVVNVNSNPTPTITSSPTNTTNLCPGTNVMLTSSAASSYLWSNAATTQIINVNTEANYTVTVTDANGCKGTSAAKSVTYQKCGKPTSLSVTNITSTGATLNWVAVNCANKYNVQYRKQGTNPWTKVNSNNASIAITGLTPNTTYEWRVRTQCDGDKSGYADGSNFTTTTLSFAKVGNIQNSLQRFDAVVYPNPAKGNATLQLSNMAKNVTITLADITGKTIWQQQQVSDASLSLPTEKLISGTYMIIVSNGKETKTLKLVKE